MTDFEHCLEKSGFSNVERLKGQSTRGDREYYSAFKNDNHVFIKRCLSEGDLQNLETERNINTILGRKLFFVEDYESNDYIAVEYFDNFCDLKDAIEEKRFDDEAIGSIVVSAFQEYVKLADAISQSDINLDCDNWIDTFRRHFFKLSMTSGWYDNPNTITILREVIVGYIALAISMLWKLKIRKTPLQTGIVHGDFHWKNIMTNGGKVEIIDVENLKKGNSNIDIAFFYVRLWYYFKKNNILMSALNDGLDCFKNSKYYDKKVFEKELNLFKFLVKHNRHFR